LPKGIDVEVLPETVSDISEELNESKLLLLFESIIDL